MRRLIGMFLISGLSAWADDIRPKSGIPEIDSLPLRDWEVKTSPLSFPKAIGLSLLPGGGQFYGGHPVRGGFLVGLETILGGLAVYAYMVNIPNLDHETSRYLDSADNAARRIALGFGNQAELGRWVGLAREQSAMSLKQTDLANSQLAWALGLHLYGITDALQIVSQSHAGEAQPHSVRRALLYGVLFPGGGQLYNASYGKFGLLWMALGASALSAWSRQNVVEHLNLSVNTARAENNQGLSTEFDALDKDRTQYRKRRNQYFWGMALLYIYATMDGMVDAALSDFDSPKRYAVGPGLEPLSLVANLSF